MDKLTGGSLTAAYGRTYTKAKDAERDFRDGKDFILHHVSGSGYCSIRDFVPGSFVQIRYGNEQVVGVEV